jgi:hypothetical protein
VHASLGKAMDKLFVDLEAIPGFPRARVAPGAEAAPALH